MSLFHHVVVVARVGVDGKRPIAAVNVEDLRGFEVLFTVIRLLRIFTSTANRIVLQHELNSLQRSHAKDNIVPHRHQQQERGHSASHHDDEKLPTCAFIKTCLILGTACDIQRGRTYAVTITDPATADIQQSSHGQDGMTVRFATNTEQRGHTVLDISTLSDVRYGISRSSLTPPRQRRRFGYGTRDIARWLIGLTTGWSSGKKSGEDGPMSVGEAVAGFRDCEAGDLDGDGEKLLDAFKNFGVVPAETMDVFLRAPSGSKAPRKHAPSHFRSSFDQYKEETAARIRRLTWQANARDRIALMLSSDEPLAVTQEMQWFFASREREQFLLESLTRAIPWLSTSSQVEQSLPQVARLFVSAGCVSRTLRVPLLEKHGLLVLEAVLKRARWCAKFDTLVVEYDGRCLEDLAQLLLRQKGAVAEKDLYLLAHPKARPDDGRQRGNAWLKLAAVMQGKLHLDGAFSRPLSDMAIDYPFGSSLPSVSAAARSTTVGRAEQVAHESDGSVSGLDDVATSGSVVQIIFRIPDQHTYAPTVGHIYLGDAMLPQTRGFASKSFVAGLFHCLSLYATERSWHSGRANNPLLRAAYAFALAPRTEDALARRISEPSARVPGLRQKSAHEHPGNGIDEIRPFPAETYLLGKRAEERYSASQARVLWPRMRHLEAGVWTALLIQDYEYCESVVSSRSLATTQNTKIDEEAQKEHDGDDKKNQTQCKEKYTSDKRPVSSPETVPMMRTVKIFTPKFKIALVRPTRHPDRIEASAVTTDSLSLTDLEVVSLEEFLSHDPKSVEVEAPYPESPDRTSSDKRNKREDTSRKTSVLADAEASDSQSGAFLLQTLQRSLARLVYAQRYAETSQGGRAGAAREKRTDVEEFEDSGDAIVEPMAAEEAIDLVKAALKGRSKFDSDLEAIAWRYNQLMNVEVHDPVPASPPTSPPTNLEPHGPMATAPECSILPQADTTIREAPPSPQPSAYLNRRPYSYSSGRSRRSSSSSDSS